MKCAPYSFIYVYRRQKKQHLNTIKTKNKVYVDIKIRNKKTYYMYLTPPHIIRNKWSRNIQECNSTTSWWLKRTEYRTIKCILWHHEQERKDRKNESDKYRWLNKRRHFSFAHPCAQHTSHQHTVQHTKSLTLIGSRCFNNLNVIDFMGECNISKTCISFLNFSYLFCCLFLILIYRFVSLWIETQLPQ